MDNFQNIYRFDKNSNIDIIVYGYSNPTKYNLLKMSEKNKAVYYTKTKRQSINQSTKYAEVLAQWKKDMNAFLMGEAIKKARQLWNRRKRW